MTPNEITKSLITLGYTQTMIAEVMGKSPSLISKVINDKATSYEVAFFIAKILGKPLHSVFPQTKNHINRSQSKYEKSKQRLSQIYSEAFPEE